MALPDGGERRTGSTRTPRETETPRNRQAIRPNPFLPKERSHCFPTVSLSSSAGIRKIFGFFLARGNAFLRRRIRKEGRHLGHRDSRRTLARLPRNLYAGNRTEQPQERACERGGSHGTDRAHVADRHHEGERASPQGVDAGV